VVPDLVLTNDRMLPLMVSPVATIIIRPVLSLTASIAVRIGRMPTKRP